MNIEAYIASGILELYALDQLSPPERAEVAGYLLEYPELRAELTEIEVSLEVFARSGQLAVSDDSLKAIESRLDALQNPADGSTGGTETLLHRLRRWRLFGGVFLAIALLSGWWLWNRANTFQTEIESLRDRVAECEEQTRTLSELNQQIAFLRQPENRFVTLGGTDAHPEAQARVVYNPEAERTLFSAAGLPEIPGDRQYQLWAIIGDQQYSLAVFDPPAPGEVPQIEVPHYGAVDAFAVTMEPRGGSPGPTLEQLYVIGEA